MTLFAATTSPMEPATSKYDGIFGVICRHPCSACSGIKSDAAVRPQNDPDIAFDARAPRRTTQMEVGSAKRHQRVDIYYSTVGLWVAPGPEELEREYLDYYEDMQKRKKMTA